MRKIDYLKEVIADGDDPDSEELNILKLRKLKESSISLLAVLNLHSDAVQIALELDELEMVRKYADLPDSATNRRQMWLLVAE
jgi:hypothetical protein